MFSNGVNKKQTNIVLPVIIGMFLFLSIISMFTASIYASVLDEEGNLIDYPLIILDVKVSEQGFAWPTPYLSSITDSYGMRYHPIKKEWRFHNGIDIAGNWIDGKGDNHATGFASPIIASKSGIVTTVAYNSSFGNYIIIDHGDGYQTKYAHCFYITATENQEVSIGQVIGLVGSTGDSTGAHLHFEVTYCGLHLDPIDVVGVNWEK